jgi:predicted metal-dependent enzyme (double-stranded beta helix superfamily)
MHGNLIRPVDTMIAELRAAIARTVLTDRAHVAAEVMRPWLGRGDLLEGCDCPSRPERYARHLLFACPEGSFSAMALVWCPGQASPIHAHRTWCAVGFHCGALVERFFRRDDPATAPTMINAKERNAGACSYGNSDPDEIHSLANEGFCPAVSFHIYGVQGDAIETGVNLIYV